MIVKFARPGQSFQGVVRYLTHDLGHAETIERVAWTRTLNCANDHLPSAVHEMFAVCRDADLLKEIAGRAAGGSVGKPVKHISLNWAPSDTPDEAAMISAATAFLQHMGWQEHQAVLVAHRDKAHPHVHLVVNAVHPETGCKLDDGFEHRRAQAWALGYEIAAQKIQCAERLKPAAVRAAADPRPAWQIQRDQLEADLRHERDRPREPFNAGYMEREENRRILEREEWQLLKEAQREEREAFFVGGKRLYGDLHRDTYKALREELRPEWAAHYAKKRQGCPSEELKAEHDALVKRQQELQQARNAAAAAALRKERDESYRALLDRQKDERRELIERQERGLRTPALLDRVFPVAAPTEGLAASLDRFGIQRGRGTVPPAAERGPSQRHRDGTGEPRPAQNVTHSHIQRPSGPSRDIASDLAGGLLSLIGGLGEALTGGDTRPSPKPAREEPDALDRFGVVRGRPRDEVAEKAAKEKAENAEYAAWRERRERDR